eukprot:6481906-Amphidinium_carterae.1
MAFLKQTVRVTIVPTKLLTMCWAQWTGSSRPGHFTGKKKEKLLARPHLPAEEEIIDDLEWPYAFEGHTLTREAAGLRCIECHKGASDIAGRPRWGYFREFRCVPKRRRGRPRRTLQQDEPPLTGRAGCSQARPGRARPRAKSE